MIQKATRREREGGNKQTKNKKKEVIRFIRWAEFARCVVGVSVLKNSAEWEQLSISMLFLRFVSFF